MKAKGIEMRREGDSSNRVAAATGPSGLTSAGRCPSLGDVLTERVLAWRAAGAMEPVADHELFVRRRDGDGVPWLLLHGFPSSSYDWRALMALRPDPAVIAFDCLGFGLSDKPPGFDYTLAWQADAAEALVKRGGHERVFVIAHDMGTSVATELMARDLAGTLGIELAGVLLFNGSILLDRASPTLGQRILRTRLGPWFTRFNTQRTFTLQFRRIFSDVHPLDPREAADQWALLAEADGHRRLAETISYMDERERYTDRWHGAVRDWPGALSFAWGLADPVATPNVLAGLKELRPHAPVTEWRSVGHYPQLEVPDRLAEVIDAATADVN